MAQQIKNTFLKSKMNKDLDDRILPNGEYRDARNISVGRSEDDDIGALENIIGNVLISSTDLNDPNLEIIGLKESANTNTVFVFLTDYTDPNPSIPTNAPVGSQHYIYALNIITQDYIKLVEGEFLNFSKTNRIIGINLIESLLFWTDNRNQPRKINTAVFNNVSQEGRSTEDQYYTKEHQISVAKYSPFKAMELYTRTQVTVKSFDPSLNWVKIEGDQVTELTPFIGAAVVSLDVASLTGIDYIFISSVALDGGDTKITFNKALDIAPTVGDILFFIKSTMTNQDSNITWPGDPNYLEDLFVRFSYRFKYDDNEYSLMAPFTQIAFIPKQKGYFINGDEEAAYRSTIVDFMENNVQNIGLIIKLPDLANRIASTYKIKEIEILFRKSDEVAVRVLESVPVSEVVLNSEPGTNVYTYDYQSRKPYRTLPEAQTVRVYDKVPVTAFAQESAGNRIIYGNYKDQHTPPSSIDYNCGISHKNTSGFSNNFIEYPNHSVKRNRNYQVGIVLADKFGRQSPVILSRVDQGSNVGGNFYSGSTIYSPYDIAAIATSPADWFGDTIELILNSPIQSVRNDALGTPGMYAVPQKNQSNGDGFAITTGGGTGINGNTWTFRYTGNTYPLNQNIPEVGDYLRGEYADFVEVLTITGPLANNYTVTTDGQVSSSYLPTINQPAGYPDIRFAYKINDLGWYSYKIVVKQTQQEYYNVYLPGILNGYPGQALLPNSEIIGDGAIEGAFPSDELNLTAHTVLFNDNINKIPRDLAELGPDQKQFRSSVKLFGRVENKMNITTSNTVPEPSNSQYYPTLNSSKNAISHTAVTIATAKDLDMAFNQLSNSNVNVLTESWQSNANQTEFAITSFTASQLQNNLITVTVGGVQVYNWSISQTSLVFEATYGAGPVIQMTVTGTSIAAGGLDGDKVFYQIDSNPLVARISTKSKPIGSDALLSSTNPVAVTGGFKWNMQPYLAVYETQPVESLLDIYWETSSEGFVADINSEVLSGFDGITSFEGVIFNFTEAASPGEAITSFFRPLNAQGVFINNTTASLVSVFDNSNPPQNVTDRFRLIVSTDAATLGEYQLALAPEVDGFVFTEGSNITDVFSFEIESTTSGGDVTTNIIQGVPEGDGALINVRPNVLNGAIPAQNWELETTAILRANAWTSAKISNGSSVITSPLPAGGYNTLGLVFSMEDTPTGINPIQQFGWEMNPSNGEITQAAANTPVGTYEIKIIATDANNVANGGNGVYAPLSYNQTLTVVIGSEGIDPGLANLTCVTAAPDGSANVPADGPILVQTNGITLDQGGTVPGFSTGIWYITAEDPGVDENNVSNIFGWSTGPGGRLLLGKSINNTGRPAPLPPGYPSNTEALPAFSDDQGAPQPLEKWMFRMGTSAHTSGTLVFNMTIAGRFSKFGLGLRAPDQFGTTQWFDGEYIIYMRKVGDADNAWKELSAGDFPEANNAINNLVVNKQNENENGKTAWPHAKTGERAVPVTSPDYKIMWGKPTDNTGIGYAHFINAFNFNEIATGGVGVEYALVMNALTGEGGDDPSGVKRTVAWLTLDDLDNSTCAPWQGENAAANTLYPASGGGKKAFLYKKSSFGNSREYADASQGDEVYFAKTPYIDYVRNFFEDEAFTQTVTPPNSNEPFLNYYLQLVGPDTTGVNPGFDPPLVPFNYGGGAFNAQMVAKFSDTGLVESNNVQFQTKSTLVANVELTSSPEDFIYKSPLGDSESDSGSRNTGMSRLNIKDI